MKVFIVDARRMKQYDMKRRAASTMSAADLSSEVVKVERKPCAMTLGKNALRRRVGRDTILACDMFSVNDEAEVDGFKAASEGQFNPKRGYYLDEHEGFQFRRDLCMEEYEPGGEWYGAPIPERLHKLGNSNGSNGVVAQKAKALKVEGPDDELFELQRKGWSLDRIARHKGVSLPAVKNRMKRARAKAQA